MTQTFSQLINQTEQLQPLLKRLPIIINFLLIIVCAQLISQVVWMLVTDSSSAPAALSSAVKPVSSKNNTQQSQQAFRNLTSAHLFGIAETTKAPVTASKIVETNLNLVLRGVLAAGTSDMASAIIAKNAGGKEEIYSINDKIPGGITLKEIHADHVILERQGRLETLRMSKDKAADAISLTNNRKRPKTTSASTRQALKKVRNNILKNPASFTQYATPVIVRENGKQIGYRLQPKQNAELFGQVGLQASDVITSIDGIKLDSMSNSISALQKLRSAKSANITVKRNGSEVPLNITLQ